MKRGPGRKFIPGNQFWKQRTKHGRDVVFSDSVILWEEAQKYFKWCDENPFYVLEFHGKDANECEVPKMRPYTYSGLCVFLDCSETALHRLKNETGDLKEAYVRICSIIYTQKFEGAAAGLFNPLIISRDLGLAERTEVKVSNRAKIIIKKPQPLQIEDVEQKQISDGEITE